MTDAQSQIFFGLPHMMKDLGLISFVSSGGEYQYQIGGSRARSLGFIPSKSPLSRLVSNARGPPRSMCTADDARKYINS